MHEYTCPFSWWEVWKFCASDFNQRTVRKTTRALKRPGRLDTPEKAQHIPKVIGYFQQEDLKNMIDRQQRNDASKPMYIAGLFVTGVVGALVLYCGVKRRMSDDGML